VALATMLLGPEWRAQWLVRRFRTQAGLAENPVRVQALCLQS
jgi:hypothetical protein